MALILNTRIGENMLFTDFLDSAENTEQETRFFEELAKVMDDLAQATQAPVVGKLIKALIALSEYGNIEAFKQSEHYPSIEGWDIHFNPDTGNFSIYPGKEQRKKIFTVLAIIGAGLFFLWLFFRCRRKNKK